MSRSLPKEFSELIEATYAPEIARTLLDALAGSEPAIAVRANTAKGVRWVGGKQVPWLPAAIYLDQRPCFALDPAWHQGLYYVQDPSSMAMTAAVKHICNTIFGNSPMRYLDACAAPGGKTIAAIEALPADSAVLANEYDPRRAAILAENIAKNGFAAAAVSVGDTARLASLGPVFDIVAVDAPCSGEGMMRKEPEAIAQWSRGLIQRCAELQQQILASCWKVLKPGGILIYSTCTFNHTENDGNLNYLIDTLGGESVELLPENFEGVLTGENPARHLYRFLPGMVNGEGLFMCAVRKPGVHTPFVPDRTPRNKKATDFRRFADKILARADRFTVIENGNSATAIPTAHTGLFAAFAKHLKTIRNGLPLGSVKGKNIIPDPETAFSNALAPDAFPVLDLDAAATLQYLHGESLSDMPDNLPAGIVLVRCNGRAAGFVKNIGRRANNLYPEALRLRLNPSNGPEKALINNLKITPASL